MRILVTLAGKSKKVSPVPDFLNKPGTGVPVPGSDLSPDPVPGMPPPPPQPNKNRVNKMQAQRDFFISLLCKKDNFIETKYSIQVYF